MAYPIQDKFVIAVSASALFDTTVEDGIFDAHGMEAYKEYQIQHEKDIYDKGVAFSFIQKFLNLNNIFADSKPAEVVLFTRNSPDLGIRIMESIKYYNLAISRTCFSSGEYNYQYLPSFNVCLFLSANEKHTRAAMKAGFAAGTVLRNHITDNFGDDNQELRFAFDFDGVIADDSSEKRYKDTDGQLDLYFDNEKRDANKPLSKGPLHHLIMQIAKLQELEKTRLNEDPSYKKIVKTAIVTARNAPADERVLTTLKEFNVSVDLAFFMGGVDKSRVLNTMRPHIYFDDDKRNLNDLDNVVAVHIPFGVLNEEI